MPDPQRKAATRRTVADWLVMQLDGDQPELWVSASSPLLAVAGCFAA